MKDNSFNGFYTEAVDSIIHRVADGISQSLVYAQGLEYTIPMDNVEKISIENATPSLDDHGEYRLYEFDCDTLSIKKIYVDNRATLCASKNGDFGANDTILVSSVYNGIKMLIMTDAEGRFKKLFVDDVLLWFDYDVEYGTHVVLQTKDGYTEIPVETFTYDSRTRISGISAISKIAKFFNTNKAITAFLKTPRGNLPKYVENTLSFGSIIFTRMANILADVDSNPELRNQCVLSDILSIGGDAAGIIAALAAEPVSGGTSTFVLTILWTDLFANIDALYNHLFPDENQMEVYKDYYKKQYGINIVTLPATDITCTDATLNGSITSSKELKGQLYFSVEPISKTIMSNGNKVSDGLWTFNSGINGLEIGNLYEYNAGYRINVDGLELIYSGNTETFKTLVDADEDGLNHCSDSGHPHFVDLGLPSGKKWACCNVGASSEEDYGTYFAWGELEAKDTYTKFNYEHRYTFDNSCKLIGLNIRGNKKYDAATYQLGQSWKMPSTEDIYELATKCTWERDTINGVTGVKVIGKGGNYIFIPHAGHYDGDELIGAGTSGDYWTDGVVSYYGDYAYAYALMFSGTYLWHLKDRNYSTFYRYMGLPIRPVCDK